MRALRGTARNEYHSQITHERPNVSGPHSSAEPAPQSADRASPGERIGPRHVTWRPPDPPPRRPAPGQDGQGPRRDRGQGVWWVYVWEAGRAEARP